MRNKTIFLSYPLSNDTIGYGGSKDFNNTQIRNMENGDACNQSHWELSNHIGTHIDSPYHFSKDGNTLDNFDASHWIYHNVELVDIDAKEGELIKPGTWSENLKSDTELLLIRTGFEKLRGSEAYWAKNPGLSPELAQWLRKYRPNIRTIGFDLISITSYLKRAEGKVAHKAYLCPSENGEPLTVVEDMTLSKLNSKIKMVVISPLIVKGSDGSPVTALATI